MNLDRRKLADADFALPNQRRYPIPDRLHARLAIGEARKWASAGERKQIAKAIKKRYPDMRTEADGLASVKDVPLPRPSAKRQTYSGDTGPGMDSIVTER